MIHPASRSGPTHRTSRAARFLTLCGLLGLASCEFVGDFSGLERRAVAYEESEDGIVAGAVISDLNGFGQATAAETAPAVDRLRRSGAEAWTPSSEVRTLDAEDLAEFRREFLEDRLLKRDAFLRMSVPSSRDAVREFEALISQLGGYVTSRQDNSMSARVPSDRFDAAWDRVQGYGNVLTQNVETSDVTEQHRDLEIRLRNLTKSHERLLTLLESAEKVEDVLAIEKELQRLTLEIERLTSQLQSLTRDVAFSLMQVEFIEYGSPFTAPVERRPGEESPYPWIRQIGIRQLLSDFEG